MAEWRKVRALLLLVSLARATVVPSAVLAETTTGGAAPSPSHPERARVHGPVLPVTEDHELTFLPGSHLYPRYLAASRQPMMRGQIVGVIENDTPATGSPLYEFALGASYGLARLHPAHEPEHGVELALHGGLIVQFDPSADYDGIGWDGFYGLGARARLSDQFAAKLGYEHQSSHLVDEYVLKTGRKRLGYTREEAVLGVMIDPSEHVRVYTEVGYAFHLGADELAPWRSESGLELRYRFLYAAVDLTFSEEANFRPTTSVQCGLMYERPGIARRYGFFAQYERGRSKYGEFYRDRFEAVSLGWWLDL